MWTGGVGYKDLLPIPHKTEPEKEEKTTTLIDLPTESYTLVIQTAKNPKEKDTT